MNIFTMEMVDKLLLPEYNPLRYFSHLGKEDKEFVLNVILPKKGYDSTRPLTLPMEERKTNHSQYDIPPVFRKAEDVYRAYRLKFPDLVSTVVKITPGETEVCSDYRKMIDNIPEELLTNSILSMISSISEIPFIGTETYIVLLEAYGNIFKNLNIYEISPVIYGLRDTFESLKSFIKMKRYRFDCDEILKTIHEYIDSIGRIDAYLNHNRFVDNKDMLFTHMLSIINLYKTASHDYNNIDVVWNSFPMLVIRNQCSNEEMLFEIMQKCWMCSESPEKISKADSKSIEKILNMVNIQSKFDIYTDEKWIDKYSIDEQVSYYALDRIKKDKMIETLFEKSGMNITEDDISFDIGEELLTFYLSEFNSKYSLILGDFNDGYHMIYDKKFYRLFKLLNDESRLYAVSCEAIPHTDDTKITLLEFVKNPDYDYIFKY